MNVYASTPQGSAWMLLLLLLLQLGAVLLQLGPASPAAPWAWGSAGESCAMEIDVLRQNAKSPEQLPVWAAAGEGPEVRIRGCAVVAVTSGLAELAGLRS